MSLSEADTVQSMTEIALKISNFLDNDGNWRLIASSRSYVQ